MGTWAGRHAQIRMPTCLGGSIILDCLTCRSPKSREQVQAPHLEPSSCREPAGAEKVLRVTTPRAPFLQPQLGLHKLPVVAPLPAACRLTASSQTHTEASATAYSLEPSNQDVFTPHWWAPGDNKPARPVQKMPRQEEMGLLRVETTQLEAKFILPCSKQFS